MSSCAGLAERRRKEDLGVLLVLICLLTSCAQHVPAPKLQPGMQVAGTVVLVQIDGLSEELLQRYLAEPASRHPSRILYRVLGASRPGAGPAQLSQAFVASVVSTFPALTDPVTATVLTGLPPSRHGVRAKGDRLAGTATTLFTQLPDQLTASAGYGATRGASFTAAGKDDRARTGALRDWLVRQTRPPSLLALHFETLRAAQAQADVGSEEEALGQIDEMLASLATRQLDWDGPGTMLVLFGGYATNLLTTQPLPITKNKITALRPELASVALHMTDGLLWTGPTDERTAASLASIPGIALVVRRTETGLLVYDTASERLRALEADDIPAEWPAFVERTEGLLRPGEVLAVASRRQSIVFADSESLLPRATSGGPELEESMVPLILAGRPLQGHRFTPPPRVTLLDVAPTVLALLKARSPGAASLGLGRNLLHAIGSSVVEPPEPELAACRADMERLGKLGAAAQAVESCRSALNATSSRSTAAEALLALAMIKQRGGASPTTVQRLVSAAYVLTDRPRQPQGRPELAPAPRASCRLLKPAVVAFGCSAFDLRRIEKERGGWGLPSDGRPVSIERCELGSSPEDDVDVVEALARLSGADAALDCSADRRRVLAMTPALAGWHGPRSLSEHVSGTSGLAARLGAAVHLSRGIAAWHHGLWRQANNHLKSAGAMPTPAEAWRLAFLSPELHRSADKALRLTAWENVLGLLSTDPSEEIHWALFVAEQLDTEFGRRTLHELRASSILAGGAVSSAMDHALPKKPAERVWRGGRADFVRATKALFVDSDWCQKPNAERRLQQLGEALAILQRLENRGLAARVQVLRAMARAQLMDLPGTLEESRLALDLMRQPGAEWTIGNLSYALLSTMNGRPIYELQAADVLQQSRRLYLTFMQRQSRADELDHLDFGEDRSLQRLLSLADPVLSRGMLVDDLKANVERAIGRQMERKRRLIKKVLASAWSPVRMLNLLTDPQRLVMDLDAAAALLDVALGAQVTQTDGQFEREMAVASALTQALHAAVLFLAGRTDRAIASFQEIEKRLQDTDDVLYEGRVRALAQERPDEIFNLAAYGPYVRLTLLGMRATIHGFIQKDYPAAQRTLKTLLTSASHFARREVAREGLDAQLAHDLSLLSAPLEPLVDLMFAVLTDQPPAVLVEAQKDLASKIRQIDIKAGCTVVDKKVSQCRLSGTALVANRWMRLAEVMIKDVHFMATTLAADRHGSRGDEQDRVQISGKLGDLTSEWKHQIEAEGKKGDLRYHGLTLLFGLESAVSDVRCLRAADFDKIVACAKNTSFLSEIQQIAADLHRDPVTGSQTARETQIVQNDSLLYLLLDLFLTATDEWTDDRAGGLAVRLKRPLTERFQSSLQRILSRTEALAGRTDWPAARNNRVMLGLLPLIMAHGLTPESSQSQLGDWLARMRAHTAGTQFSGAGWYFDLLAYYFDRGYDAPAAAGARWERRLALLDQVQKQCPALGSTLDMARAGIAFTRGQNSRGYALLDHYIESVVQAERGNDKLHIAIDAQHENTQASLALAIELDRLLNPYSSITSLRFSLGWYSITKNSFLVTSGYERQSSASQAIAQALAVKAWTALLSSELAIADRSLADLVALGAGLEPRFLLKNPTQLGRNLASLDVFIDPLLGLWLATLADLRGYHSLAEPIFVMAERSAQWHQGSEVSPVRCDQEKDEELLRDEQAEQMSSGARFLLKRARCAAPAVLATGGERDPMRHLVYLRWRRYLQAHHGIKAAAVAEVEWNLAVAAAQLDLGRPLLPERPERKDLALNRQGYDCEAGTLLIERKGPAKSVLDHAEQCGSSGLMLSALTYAAATSADQHQALRYISHALALTSRFSFDTGQGSVLLKHMNDIAVQLAEDRPEQLPAWLRQIAVQIEKQEWAQPVALHLRALALAAEYMLGYPLSEPYAPLLRQARKQSPGSPAFQYLDQMDQALFLLSPKDQHRTLLVWSRKLLRGQLQ